jgi:hypothetical protein
LRGRIICVYTIVAGSWCAFTGAFAGAQVFSGRAVNESVSAEIGVSEARVQA